MDTPLLDMLKAYSEEDNLRLHMPGHKGRLSKYDITEVDGADSLFEASGVIKRSEENAGRIFGADTFYSTEGSSLSIRTMVYLVTLYAKRKGEEPLILAQRNVHRSFVTALALTGAEAQWLIPKSDHGFLSCPVSAEEVKTAIEKRKPTAVYLTSPDYLGGISDIREIAKVCHKAGVLLLVDNAHGAYLKFLKDSRHPIDLGADMCSDSAHKTLEVLGGGAYLHISKNADPFFKEYAKEAMALFASTSPSYLILVSLDEANAKLAENFTSVLTSFIDKIELFDKRIARLGYKNISREPLKITIDANSYGYTGSELCEGLRGENIVAEFYDREYIVLMLSPYMTDSELERLYTALARIEKKEKIEKPALPYTLAERVLSPREAVFAPSERLPIAKCLGRIASSVTLSCPPAVPIIVSGERIDENTLKVAEYYGIEDFSVVI